MAKGYKTKGFRVSSPKIKSLRTKIVGYKTPSRSIPGSTDTGRRVSQNEVNRRTVRRVFARDPAKANSLIGTPKDKRFDQVNVNTNGAPSRPRILRAPRDAVKGAGATPQTSTPRQSRIVTKINRSIKKR